VAHQRGSTDAISSDTLVCNTLLVTIKHILAEVVTISWNDVLADEQSTWGKKLEKENELSFPVALLLISPQGICDFNEG